MSIPLTTAIHHGRCADVLPSLSADVVITDPPYELGFMGREWDRSGVSYRPETWAAVRDTLPPGGYLLAFGGSRTFHRIACAIEDGGFELRDTLMWLYGTGFPKSKALLKPAFEPIILARKPGPLRDLSIDECRIAGEPWKAPTATGLASVKFFTAGSAPVIHKEPHNGGRWPANVLLSHGDCEDGCAPDCPVRLLDEQSGISRSTRTFRGLQQDIRGGRYNSSVSKLSDSNTERGHNDTGGASRFFYCAKASRTERGEGNDHPTVKPLALMRWLVRLVTKPNDVILDPFMGSGTTLLAAVAEKRWAIGVDQDAHACDIARSRLSQIARYRLARADVQLPLEVHV